MSNRFPSFLIKGSGNLIDQNNFGLKNENKNSEQ